jgi:hypothetical protein
MANIAVRMPQHNRVTRNDIEHKQMSKDQDEAFILTLHLACRNAEQNGFHHTKQALLAMLAREVGQTEVVGAQSKTGDQRNEETSACTNARPAEYQFG